MTSLTDASPCERRTDRRTSGLKDLLPFLKIKSDRNIFYSNTFLNGLENDPLKAVTKFGNAPVCGRLGSKTILDIQQKKFQL